MDNKTLYLHLGMDKTGTSALQEFLYRNRAELMQEKRLRYPKAGLWRDRSHHPFAFSVFGLYDYSENDLHGLFQALAREIGGTDGAILSSECLFKAPQKDSFKTFYGLVRSTFDDVKVVVYVRRQDLWVESRHKHSIISGAELSLEMLQRPQFCDYKQFIDRWAELVGSQGVTVRAYEKQQFTGGSIFSDFLSLFGMPLDERYSLPTENLNVSLGRDETWFKKLCNDLGFVSAGSHGLNRALVDRARTAPRAAKENAMLSPAQRAELVGKYSAVNAAIATEYMGREDGVLFRDPLPDPGEPWEPYQGPSQQEFLELWNYIGQYDPETINLLEWAMSSALSSGDEVKEHAARTLRSALAPGA